MGPATSESFSSHARRIEQALMCETAVRQKQFNVSFPSDGFFSKAIWRTSIKIKINYKFGVVLY